jgi:deazaflavin-dependent oxidoreductase (nitroreductase family)
MPASSSITHAAAGLLRTRWLVRAPVWLYRARLGILLGPRFLMLEHTGRKSGARRYVVLEVAEHRPPGTYVVVSGFGDRAQWFRNILAGPRVRVYVLSRKPAAATARVLPQQEATAALAAYSARHPRAWAAMKPVLQDTLGSRRRGRVPVARDRSRTRAGGLTAAQGTGRAGGPGVLGRTALVLPTWGG